MLNASGVCHTHYHWTDKMESPHFPVGKKVQSPSKEMKDSKLGNEYSTELENSKIHPFLLPRSQ